MDVNILIVSVVSDISFFMSVLFFIFQNQAVCGFKGCEECPTLH